MGTDNKMSSAEIKKLLWLDYSTQDLISIKNSCLAEGKSPPDNVLFQLIAQDLVSEVELKKLLGEPEPEPNLETIRIGKEIAKMDLKPGMTRAERRAIAQKHQIPWRIFQRIEKVIRIGKG